MTASTSQPPPPSSTAKVYIFEPCLRHGEKAISANSAHLSSECDKRACSIDISQRLVEVGFEVEIVELTVENYSKVLDECEAASARSGREFVVLNLCDGTEKDGYPGLTVVREMERRNVAFSGADSVFYHGTTCKIFLKNNLRSHGVPTSPFVRVTVETLDAAIEEAGRTLGYPMIMKPCVSYASIGISDRSIVHNERELREHFLKETAGGAKSASSTVASKSDESGFFVEKYLGGREFTALCTGDEVCGVTVYPVVERVFNGKLGPFERLLAFERYWAGYDLEGGRPVVEEQLYHYAAAPEEWQEVLSDVARRAYIAVCGTGYGRVDMRTSKPEDSDVYVLEVNANCGMSFQPGTSSCAEIIRISQTSPYEFVKSLIQYAQDRRRRLQPQ